MSQPSRNTDATRTSGDGDRNALGGYGDTPSVTTVSSLGSGLVRDVELTVGRMAAAIGRGRRPAADAVAALRVQVAALPRDGAIPAWRLAEIDESVREIVRHAMPAPVVAAPRATAAPSAAATSARQALAPSAQAAAEVRFERLRRRVDSLYDLVEAGRRPTYETLDEVREQLISFRRTSDGPEIRQMIDDVPELRRRVVAASPPPTARIASSRSGRGFWGQPVAERAARRRPRPARRRSPARIPTPEHGRAVDPERVRVEEEARALRDRADRFAAARTSGRTFPLQETRRLFLHFKALRSRLDAETRALNDAAVLRLVQAFEEAGRPCQSSRTDT